MSLLLDVDLFLRDHGKNLKISQQAGFLLYRFAGLIGSRFDTWISQNSLASMIGISRFTIIRQIKELKEHDLLVVSPDPIDKKKNRYRFAEWLINYYQARTIAEQYVTNLSPKMKQYVANLQHIKPPYVADLQPIMLQICNVPDAQHPIQTPVAVGIQETCANPKETTKGQEDKETTIAQAQKAHLAHDESFEQFWNMYPRKKDKKKAKVKWKKIPIEKIPLILEKLKDQISLDINWQQKEFVPHPSTYIHNARWEDEIEEKGFHCETRQKNQELTEEQKINREEEYNKRIALSNAEHWEKMKRDFPHYKWE